MIIQVDDGGTLALMQQMVNLKELGCSPPLAPPPSPAHAVAAAPSPTMNPFSLNKDIVSQPQQGPAYLPNPINMLSSSASLVNQLNFASQPFPSSSPLTPTSLPVGAIPPFAPFPSAGSDPAGSDPDINMS